MLVSSLSGVVPAAGPSCWPDDSDSEPTLLERPFLHGGMDHVVWSDHKEPSFNCEHAAQSKSFIHMPCAAFSPMSLIG